MSKKNRFFFTQLNCHLEKKVKKSTYFFLSDIFLCRHYFTMYQPGQHGANNPIVIDDDDDDDDDHFDFTEFGDWTNDVIAFRHEVGWFLNNLEAHRAATMRELRQRNPRGQNRRQLVVMQEWYEIVQWLLNGDEDNPGANDLLARGVALFTRLNDHPEWRQELAEHGVWGNLVVQPNPRNVLFAQLNALRNAIAFLRGS